MDALYALYVTNAARAVRELGEAGIAAMNLTYKRALPGRGITIDEPIFCGYVFARIAPGQFKAAKDCEHVAFVVGPEGVALQIPEEEFTPILTMALTGKLDERPNFGKVVAKAVARAKRRKAKQRLSKWTDGRHAKWYEAARNITKAAA